LIIRLYEGSLLRLHRIYQQRASQMLCRRNRNIKRHAVGPFARSAWHKLDHWRGLIANPGQNAGKQSHRFG
jgi:hypothetical protein